MPDARRSTRTHAGAADYVGPPGRVVRLLKRCRFTFRGGTIGLSRVHEVMHLLLIQYSRRQSALPVHGQRHGALFTCMFNAHQQ